MNEKDRRAVEKIIDEWLNSSKLRITGEEIQRLMKNLGIGEKQ